MIISEERVTSDYTSARLSCRSGFAVLLALLFIACSGPPYEPAEDETTLIIGHAGMGFSQVINPFNPLPDNSMAAILKAMELGADGVEVDVQLTKDSVVILYHDNFLDSKTGLEGCIYNYEAKDLLGSPYRTGFPYNFFHDEGLIGLDSLLKVFKKRKVFPPLYFDIHSFDYCGEHEEAHRHTNRFARALNRTVKKWKAPTEKIFYTSSHIPFLNELKRLDSTSILLYEEGTKDFEKALNAIKNNGFHGMVIKEKNVPGDSVLSVAKQSNMHIVYFGGRTKGSILKMLETRPSAIQVNNVKAMVDIIRRDEN